MSTLTDFFRFPIEKIILLINVSKQKDSLDFKTLIHRNIIVSSD